ncbi:hypothetical protein D3C72_2033460 [compost metagenome]
MRQPALQRRQQKGQTDAPRQRIPERRQHPVQRQAAQGGDTDDKTLEIEIHARSSVTPMPRSGQPLTSRAAGAQLRPTFAGAIAAARTACRGLKTTGNQPHQEHHDGDDQQDVNETAEGV